MLIYEPHIRQKQDLSNTKRVLEEIHRFSELALPLKPDELKLSLITKHLFGENDKYRIICNDDEDYDEEEY